MIAKLDLLAWPALPLPGVVADVVSHNRLSNTQIGSGLARSSPLKVFQDVMSIRLLLLSFLSLLTTQGLISGASLRKESFDTEPTGWEGINNRGSPFEPKTVTQVFGFSGGGQHTGLKPGEVGGIINPAAEPAYYGYRLPKLLTLKDRFEAS